MNKLSTNIIFFSTIAKRNFDKLDNIEEFIIDKINIKDLENYIIQGITKIKDEIWVSSYNENKTINSKIFIIKNNELIKTIELYNNAHVGSITYDDISNIVWITDKSGTISGYNYNELKNNNNIPLYKKIEVAKNIINIYGNNAASYMTYFDKMLFVGNYNVENLSYLNIYNINKNGEIKNKINTINFLELTQGLTFYKKNNKTYMIVSSSSGNTTSQLKIYEYKNNIDDYRKEKYINIYLPPMLEQISIYKNELICAFESNARKYQHRKLNTPDILVLSIENIIEKHHL